MVQLYLLFASVLSTHKILIALHNCTCSDRGKYTTTDAVVHFQKLQLKLFLLTVDESNNVTF